MDEECHAGSIVGWGKGVVGGRAFVFNGKWRNVEVTGGRWPGRIGKTGGKPGKTGKTGENRGQYQITPFPRVPELRPRRATWGVGADPALALARCCSAKAWLAQWTSASSRLPNPFHQRLFPHAEAKNFPAVLRVKWRRHSSRSKRPSKGAPGCAPLPSTMSSRFAYRAKSPCVRRALETPRQTSLALQYHHEMNVIGHEAGTPHAQAVALGVIDERIEVHLAVAVCE